MAGLACAMPTASRAADPAQPAAGNANSTTRPAVAADKTALPRGGAAKPSANASAGADEGPFSPFRYSANNGPVQIHSNSLNVDYKSRLVEFQGDVHATQSGTTLTSQTLKVIYGDKFNQVQKIIAVGNVKVVQGGRWVTGQQAVLDEVHHTLEMTGEPVIHDGPDKVAGNRIIVYLDSQKSFVEGASAMIFPRTTPNDTHDASSRKSAAD